jgi:hypothetical protein
VFELFEKRPELLAESSLSALLVSDKQDPSLVIDISALYKHFLDAGYSALGMYLKAIFTSHKHFMTRRCHQKTGYTGRGSAKRFLSHGTTTKRPLIHSSLMRRSKMSCAAATVCYFTC